MSDETDISKLLPSWMQDGKGLRGTIPPLIDRSADVNHGSASVGVTESKIVPSPDEGGRKSNAGSNIDGTFLNLGGAFVVDSSIIVGTINVLTDGNGVTAWEP